MVDIGPGKQIFGYNIGAQKVIEHEKFVRKGTTRDKRVYYFLDH
jgi:hypothetical protein